MFELNQLRSFIAVAMELNFRRAAKRLNMTQPPLSRQIQMLEYEVGAPLFDRAGRNVRLTAAGSRFLTEAQDILRLAETAALSAKRADLGGEGSVVLGFLPFSALCLLPTAVTLLRDAFPAVDVVLKEMNTADQIEALSSGLIDLGILRMPCDRSGLNLTRLHQETYLLAMHRDHELVHKDNHVIQDLHRQELLMHTPSEICYGYDGLDGLLSVNEIKPRSIHYFMRTVTILSMVNAGVGMALVPASAKNVGFTNVVFKAVDVPSVIQSEHFLGWSSAIAEAPLVQRVRRTLIDAFRQEGQVDRYRFGRGSRRQVAEEMPERALVS